ncbi:hypothetical protein [Actinokineospora iranica]|uniref:Uncharacterized protein n=1 Tax=Actinokineospora iranica TaxID=1271860 RepID=A0A1G6J1B6_9PSEU|nr:hypothetical protein [Actinokineospora iranica]SDC12614.1 hypothetical protein SAMN05216174_101193 [Actinokineospora iranica]
MASRRAEWARTDERDFDTVLDIGAGSSLGPSRGEEDKPLTLVEGEKRAELSAHVRGLWTPPQLGTPPASPPGTQEMALRFAPTVAASRGEELPWRRFRPQKDGRLSAYLYWFFYPYNDFHIGASPNLRHEGDWERVAVQIDGDRPVGVAFAKHGGPACSKPWNDMAKSGTHAEVFSAKGSHASYPFIDEYPTLCPTSDHTGKGFAWDAATSLLNVKDQPWYGYRGLWGELGVHKNTTGPAGPWPKRDMSASLTTEKC